MLAYKLAESGLIPISLLRKGIDYLLFNKLKIEYQGDFDNQEFIQNKITSFVKYQNSMPLAIATDLANEQHYEVDSRFFELVLGSNLKYSSGLWQEDTQNLNDAEENMLKLYCDFAQIKDGQKILELGCGWGSLVNYIIKNYPNCQITAISNSNSQRHFIETRISTFNHKNVKIITTNVANLELDEQFDRILSIEMFEHIKNWSNLLTNISKWMHNESKLFIHIFTHKELCYNYDHLDPEDWMSKYFFAGGIMPSNNLLLYHQENLKIIDHKVINGTNYQKTANCWVENMLKNKSEILNIFSEIYGKDKAKLWYQRWILFFLACAQLWGYNSGNEWMVSHYLFKK